MWLLGGPADLMERLTAALPALAVADVVHVPEDDLVACYRTEMRDKHGEPSSGWIGAPLTQRIPLIKRPLNMRTRRLMPCLLLQSFFQRSSHGGWHGPSSRQGTRMSGRIRVFKSRQART